MNLPSISEIVPPELSIQYILAPTTGFSLFSIISRIVPLTSCENPKVEMKRNIIVTNKFLLLITHKFYNTKLLKSHSKNLYNN